MTFGQHLEELRTCLFRAIIGLAIGCCIGLLPWVCGPVVRFINTPVENALMNYYREQANKLTVEETKTLSDAGYNEKDLQRISEILANEHVSLEVVQVDPDSCCVSCNYGQTPHCCRPPAANPPQMPAV